MVNDPLHISVKAVSDQFMVTPATVYNWISKGKLVPMIDICGKRNRYFVTRKSLEEFRFTETGLKAARRLKRLDAKYKRAMLLLGPKCNRQTALKSKT